jgi:hypothetical protein
MHDVHVFTVFPPLSHTSLACHSCVACISHPGAGPQFFVSLNSLLFGYNSPPSRFSSCNCLSVRPFTEELTVTSGKLISHCILSLHLCCIYNAPINLAGVQVCLDVCYNLNTVPAQVDTELSWLPAFQSCTFILHPTHAHRKCHVGLAGRTCSTQVSPWLLQLQHRAKMSATGSQPPFNVAANTPTRPHALQAFLFT